MPYQDGVYYYAYHPQDRDRTPIVLIHGAGGDYLHWPVQMRRLPGYRIYALDLPGHGKSERHGLQSVGGYAQAVTDWLNGVEIPRAIFIGHSMGGAIALWLGIHHQQRVQGLGLVGAGPTLPVNPTLLEETAHASSFPAAVNKIIKWSFSPHTDRSLVETARERMLETRPSVLFGDFKACDQYNIEDHLQNIKAPTKIICGGDDKMVPLPLSRQLDNQIPNSDLEVIPETGHMLMIEKPDGFVSRIKPFLDVLSSPS